MANQSGFAVPYDLKSPLTTPRGLKDPRKAASQLEDAAKEIQEQFGALDVPWGQVMRFQFAGLAPGFVGLYQVNIQIPSTAMSGNTVPLELTFAQGAGRPSNIVTIAVQ